MTDIQTLDDLMPPGLDLVFVGINPPEYSAQRRHYYSHPTNRFWRWRSDSTLVDRKVGPADDDVLPERDDIGFTDVVKRVETDSRNVTPAELRAAAPDFKRRIADASPRVVCFNGKKAFEAVFPRKWTPGAWGRHDVPLAGAMIWVMPSSSGSAGAYHKDAPRVLRDLACALGRRTRR